MKKWTAAASVVALALLPVLARAEVVWLRNGDRLTGAIVSETPKNIRLKLAFAIVLIPKSRIERLVRADGKEEVLNPPEGATPSPAPSAPPPPRLVLAVTGASFWQAWDRKAPPADPSLRLELRIDEQPVAAWTDAHLDPEDLPGAVVNTFAFTSGDEAGTAAPGVLLSPPEPQPGRVLLRLELPGVSADRHTVRVAYQVNEASAESPSWREIATTAAPVTFRTDAPTVLQLRQQRGQMEYSRKHMRGVDTFGLELAAE